MARPTATEQKVAARRKRRRTARVPAGMTLALWRGKRMWRLLLVVELGMVAAVLLVCAVPLFSQVAMTAGLEQKLADSPIPLDLEGTIGTNAPSTTLYQQVEQRLKDVIATDLRAFHVGAPVFQATSEPLAFQHANGGPYDGLTLEGFLDTTLGTRATVLQGRLPQTTAYGLEMAMTSKTASTLGLALGSTVTIGAATSSPIPLRLVGIISSNNPAQYSNFEPHAQGGPNDPGGASSTGYIAIVSANALFNSPYDLSTVAPANTPPNLGYGPGIWTLNWSYPLAVGQLGPNDLNALLDDPNGTQQHLYSMFDNLPLQLNLLLDQLRNSARYCGPT